MEKQRALRVQASIVLDYDETNRNLSMSAPKVSLPGILIGEDTLVLFPYQNALVYSISELREKGVPLSIAGLDPCHVDVEIPSNLLSNFRDRIAAVRRYLNPPTELASVSGELFLGDLSLVEKIAEGGSGLLSPRPSSDDRECWVGGRDL